MTEQLFNEITTWQSETFPNANAFSKACHLRQEVEELIIDLESDNPNRRLEFADIFLLAYGAAKADGMTFQDCIDAVKEKFEINKKRKWGKPDSNGVIK